MAFNSLVQIIFVIYLLIYFSFYIVNLFTKNQAKILAIPLIILGLVVLIQGLLKAISYLKN